MTSIVETPPDVDSLSARQVRLLLRTVAKHKSYLDAAHYDATLLAQRGLRPAYLLDFDLLYMFMFEYEEHVDWGQELQFLIHQPDTLYIIGPGTQTELIRLRERSRDGRSGRVSAHEIARRLPELAKVLRRPNVLAYEELVESMQVDDEAYDIAKATLDRTRRLRKEDANQADALNWAAVVHLRRNGQQMGLGGFPYLLTGTEPLLREEAWDPESGVPISRGPGAAIYSQVLLETYPSPTEAVGHTIDGAFQIAQVERDLRTSPAYLAPERYQSEPDWEQTLATGRVGGQLREQLSSLAGWIDDDVIYMTQRLYDNADLVAVNLASQSQGRRSRHGHESPRRLFDLIASLNAAIATDGAEGLSALWRTVLDLVVRERDGFTLYELRDRGARSDKPPYFSLELHDALDPDEDATLFVMRWPCGIDAESILVAVGEAFQRHDVGELVLSVGMASEVARFAVELPVTLDDIVVHLPADASSGDGQQANVCWLRFDGTPFDLYADVAADIPHDPVIGVFAPTLNAAHVVDLYEKSSARYLFPAWLRGALEHIRTMASDRGLDQSEHAPDAF